MEELGCYYMHIFYPSHLCLKQVSPFEFDFDGDHYFLLVVRSLSSLITNDFSNKIVESIDENGLYHYELTKKEIDISDNTYFAKINDGTIAYALDGHKTLYTEFYSKDYTELILFFEAKRDVNNIIVARRALDYFIDTYRMVSGDVLTLPLNKATYVSIVTKEYFYVYSEEDLKAPKQDRNKVSRELKLGVKEMTLPFWGTQGKKLVSDESKIATSLTKYFHKNAKPGVLQEFLLKAREELHVHKNYKYSFIETWTALEIAISTYMREAKLAKGISKNKIDDFESEVGISYLINIELPLVHLTNDENFKSLITKVDAIRKLRNKVIHQNRDINFAEADNAYQTARDFLAYMGILKINSHE